jgi:hypothetical protein
LRKRHPFAQALVGGAHASGTFTPTLTNSSDNAFAAVAGGGLDVDLAEHLGLRALEVDYYFTHFPNATNDHQNNLRAGAGFYLRFGSRSR